MGDDRYKHLVLICDDARVVISFAGIAGIIYPSKKGPSILKHETIDWLTEVLRQTSKKSHRIDDHLNDLRDQIQPHIAKLKKQCNLSSDALKFAIQISGWVGKSQFDCVIDNYLDSHVRAGPTRQYFETRYKIFEDKMFEDGSKILIIGEEYLKKENDYLCQELLFEASLRGDPKEIFATSVKIIRTAAADSNGCVGLNCSGIKISRNDPGIECFDKRDEPIWDVVMPNTIYSTSRISCSTTNILGRTS